jgi:hypothetical protein
VANLSAVEALILLSRCVNVHGLALSTKDYSSSGSLVLRLGAWFVSDYRVTEEVSAPTFKAKLFLSLFVISGDAKDDVLVSLVRVWLCLCGDNLVDVLVQDGSIQEIDKLLV